MALTLTEGNKYSTTELDSSVIDLLVKDSVILEKLPFESLLGNSLTYDMITTDSTVSFRLVGETWTESTPSLTQDTVTLKILGGDADIDNFILSTRSNKIDLKAQILANRVKAIQHKFLDTFYYGNASTSAEEFSGMQKLLTSTTYNTVHAGAGTGSVLSMAKLYEALDLPKVKPDILVMSKVMRRSIQVYLDTIGEKYPRERDQFGKMQETLMGYPIFVTDHILNTETAASGAYTASTGGACTTIFGVKFGSQECCGVQGSKGVETLELGDLETKDASRYRIRWYCGLKFENLTSCVKLDGITAAGTVTA